MTCSPTVLDLADRLLADTSLLARVLAHLSLTIPVTPVLVIDQAEEMFTLARSPTEEWCRDRAVEMIRKVGEERGDFKLIVSLRTEYYGRLVSAPAARQRRAERSSRVPADRTSMCTRWSTWLGDQTLSARPALRGAEVPFEKYAGFDYADGVPEEIAHQVARHGRMDGVALLLQVVCAQLFERAMARTTIVSPISISARSAASRAH